MTFNLNRKASIRSRSRVHIYKSERPTFPPPKKLKMTNYVVIVVTK
jgi:hypothetical protein